MVIFPKVLRIEPASKCNLACVHCPTGIIEMERGVMSLDIFQKILIEIQENKENIKVIVLYHGGEPFLNKNFFKMVKQIKEINNNFYIKTVSNGTVLNEKIIDQIVCSDIDLIEFSLDGYSLEDSEKIRKKSSASKTIENIKKLLEKKKN
jgi:MoaA/NifB/PqqE/SkfB family radical SAM enzyme